MSTSITPDNIERVLQIFVAIRRMSLRMMADKMNIGNDSASIIVHGHFKSGIFVPGLYHTSGKRAEVNSEINVWRFH